MGKILASDFAALKNECNRWSASYVTTGVSSGSKATASSMNSVFESVYNIYASDNFMRFAPHTADVGSAHVTVGQKIYQTDLNYVVGKVEFDDKVGYITSGLLTYAQSVCLHCTCHGSCDGSADHCGCDGASHCSCNTVAEGCDNYCASDYCDMDGALSPIDCPGNCHCNTISHVCGEYSCFCHEGGGHAEQCTCHAGEHGCTWNCASHCASHCSSHYPGCMCD